MNPVTDPARTVGLSRLLQPYADRAEAALDALISEPGAPAELDEAMRYCVLEGGKRLRPALVYLAAEAAGGGRKEGLVDRAAAAVEMVHAYSLVHDDLPAMDDDDLRRGRPTAHVRFGEAMAILSGDALLTRAFGVLAEAGGRAAADLVRELALGAGPAGMIAGQVADMDLCRMLDGSAMRYIHERKTGALIRAAVRMGGVCAGADADVLDCLGRYGEALGLAFQAVDDILDVAGDAEQLGKTPGKDAAAGKRTVVASLGLDQARAHAEDWTRRASHALEPLGARSNRLKDLAELLGRRTH